MFYDDIHEHESFGNLNLMDQHQNEDKKK